MKSIKKEMFRGNHISFFLTVLFVALKSGVDSMIAIVFKMALDIVTEGTGAFDQLIKVSTMVVISYLLIGTLMLKFYQQYKVKAMNQYRCAFIDQLLRMKIRDMKKDNQGKFLSAVNVDMKTIEDHYIEGIVNLVMYASRIALCTTLMFLLSYRMTLVIMVFVIIPAFIIKQLNRKFISQKKAESDYASEFNVLMKELLSGFTVIKSFCMEDIILEDVKSKSLVYEKKKVKAFATINWMDIITTSIVLLCMLITFGWGAYLTKSGFITIGTVTAVAQLMSTVFSSFNPMTRSFSKLEGSKAIITKLDEMIQHSPEEVNSGKIMLCDRIELKNLSFGYGSEMQIVKNVNFKFEKKKAYAVVGMSGCGKSTLLQLINGYYDDYTGEILIDETDVRKLSSEEIGKIISAIQQEVFLFDDSLLNNLTLKCEYPKEEILQVVEKIGMQQFTTDNGELLYHCGENGVNLSGGQKQRISIGRALLRKNSVLLLDEVTSALDPEMARVIEELILQLTDVMRIVVTHRLEKTMLERYDAIIVMNKGRIEECGRFEELLDNKGLFYSLYHTYDS